MGVNVPLTAGEKRARLIGPLHCMALRLALGLSIDDLAKLAGLPADEVRRVEWRDRDGVPDLEIGAKRGLVSDALQSIGGTWCAPDPHDGANSVHLSGRAIGDGLAIRVALVLMRTKVDALARRVHRRAGITRADLWKSLRRCGEPMPPLQAAECFHQLRKAGAYFEPGPDGGWCLIGCHPKGALW